MNLTELETRTVNTLTENSNVAIDSNWLARKMNDVSPYKIDIAISNLIEKDILFIDRWVNEEYNPCKLNNDFYAICIKNNK